MILLVTSSRSVHADLVESHLKDKTDNYFRLNVDRLIIDYAVSWREDNTGWIFNKHSGSHIELSQINVVWWYDFPDPLISGLGIDKRYGEWVKYESKNGLIWILSSLNSWYMSNPEAINFASIKSIQLLKAQEVGLNVPKTIISNYPSEISSFIRSNKESIFKTISPISREKGLKSRVIYTTIVNQNDINDETLTVKLNLFQDFIKKEYDVRATVVCDKVFAVKIESQASEKTSVDWRRYDIANTPHRAFSLPEDIELKCVKVTKKLGLNYGAIDLARSNDGKYVFLEINPIGLWAWLEGLTGMPISEEISDALIINDLPRGELH